LDRRFRDLIAPAVADFNARWQQLAEQLCAGVKAEFDRNLQSPRSQFEQVLQHHTRATSDANERRRHLNALHLELERCQKDLVGLAPTEITA
jgi:flagellar biosynthesis chaperone FliJ